MSKSTASEPNYLRKLRFLMKAGALPTGTGLHQVDVYHDDWCGIYQDKRCNCNPDINPTTTFEY